MKRFLQAAAIASSLTGCSGDAPIYVAPSVELVLQLPAELAPQAVPCLDIDLSAVTGEPPRTSAGFGGDPLLLKLATLDTDGDGRTETTRIRFVNGSVPFHTSAPTIRLTRSKTDSTNSAFVVRVVARKANGLVDPADTCLAGTAIVSASAEVDQNAQPIRFPSRGSLTIQMNLACVLAGGCALAFPDGGANDGGANDGGVTDGGAADGG